MALIHKALSDENRLRIILCLLTSGNALSVTELVNLLGISQPLTSHHLKELRYAGILRHKRKGPFVYYEIASREISRVIEASLALIRGGHRLGDSKHTTHLEGLLQGKARHNKG